MCTDPKSNHTHLQRPTNTLTDCGPGNKRAMADDGKDNFHERLEPKRKRARESGGTSVAQGASRYVERNALEIQPLKPRLVNFDIYLQSINLNLSDLLLWFLIFAHAMISSLAVMRPVWKRRFIPRNPQASEPLDLDLLEALTLGPVFTVKTILPLTPLGLLLAK